MGYKEMNEAVKSQKIRTKITCDVIKFENTPYIKKMCVKCKFLDGKKCLKNRKPIECAKKNLRNKE